MTSTIRRGVLAAGIAVAAAAPVALAASTPSTAPPKTVKLKVKGPGSHHSARFCGKSKSVYVFPRGSQLTYKGDITPAPASHFPVVVKLERCSRGHWTRLQGNLTFEGKKVTGKFKAVHAAPPATRAKVTYYSAIAVVNGRESNKRYFGIHR